MTLQDRVALVTGASSDIGAACAKALAAKGAGIVVHYNSHADAAERVADAITAGGGKAVTAKADLTEPAAIDRLVATTVAAFGRLDVLVNNAAIGEPATLPSIDADHIDRLFKANVASVLLATRAAVGTFGKDGGVIINISSINGARPVAGGVVYSATKAAVDAITKGLAAELGPRRIRVNAVAPGATDTATLRAFLTKEMESAIGAQTICGRRLGQPDDIGAVVAFLASPEAAWITGQIINASGGLQI